MGYPVPNDLMYHQLGLSDPVQSTMMDTHVAVRTIGIRSQDLLSSLP